MSICIASYNIQYGFGQDGTYDLSRIAATLMDCDIICLQEVTTNWAACNGDDQPALLARQLNLFSSYAAGFEVDAGGTDSAGRRINARRGFGNMVLSKWPILYSRNHTLPRPMASVPDGFAHNVDLPRCAIETVVASPTMPLRIFSVHLSHLPGEQRLAQVAALRSLIVDVTAQSPMWPRDADIPIFTEGHAAPPVTIETILMGDFNLGPSDAEYAALCTGEGIDRHGALLIDGWRAAGNDYDVGRTCRDDDGSLLTLDYGLFSARLSDHITSAHVDQSTAASDHFPLRFELDL
jgi:endonuclease/exonuclease/phosphatase family metal-dependent hydrolase